MLNYTAVDEELIQTAQSRECIYSTHQCICHHVLLKREHFQAVQFLSQVKRRAAAGTQRWQGPHFATRIILFCICSKIQSCVFVDMGVLQCSALEKVTTFSALGRNGRSKFYRILSFLILTGLSFRQVLLIRSRFQCSTENAKE